MKLYRFSPIKSKKGLFLAIKHLHFEAHKLCKQAFGEYYPNAGNIGVFCHYNHEFALLKKIREELTESTNNPDLKYFKLYKPIIIPQQGDVPETVYTHLYIRKPDPYRHHVGDVDFYLDAKAYQKLKQSLLAGTEMKGARVFERPDLDMIELYDPDIDVLTYVSTKMMTEKVRVKLPETTKL